MIVEASNPEHLARGIQGLAGRMARAINRVFERKGSLFSGRYHATLISSSWTARNMLRYVLSSGPWFDYWADPGEFLRPPGPPPVAEPRCPLFCFAYRFYAPIGLYELPGPGRCIHFTLPPSSPP